MKKLMLIGLLAVLPLGASLQSCSVVEKAAEVAAVVSDPENVDKAAVSGIATLEAVNNTVAMLVESGKVGPDDAESIVDRTDALYADFVELRESVNDPDAVTSKDRLLAQLKTLLSAVEKQYGLTIYGTPSGGND